VNEDKNPDYGKTDFEV